MESNTQQDNKKVTTTKAKALVARVRPPKLYERSREQYKAVPLVKEFGLIDRIRLAVDSTHVEGHALAKERHFRLGHKHQQKELEARATLVKHVTEARVRKETGANVDVPEQVLEQAINEAIDKATVNA